jgi:hypothetical protein
MDRDTFDSLAAAEARHVVSTIEQRGGEHRGNEDALGGWRKRGLLGIAVRLEEKLERLDVICKHPRSAEYVREVLTDIAGYALCGLVWARACARPADDTRDSKIIPLTDEHFDTVYGEEKDECTAD